MNKIFSITFALFAVFLLATMPVNAQLFLCEKTADNQTIAPDNPQYDRVDYTHEGLVSLSERIVRVGMIGSILFGIFGGIYASVRDAFFTPTDDDDPAKYARMRIKVILSGILLPPVIMIGGFILEYITTYEVTCMLPNIL